MESLIHFLRDERFMPHGHCYLWLPELLWLNVVSDTLIALAYLSIPVTLIYFIQKRHDLPFNWMFGAFGVFILACGSTHVMDIWVIWHPDYWVAAFIKAVTASASIITAILLIKLVPVALRIPSQQQLTRVNGELIQANKKLHNTQQELMATARQAGMAEIASNVLHNVGNVLNSVNVSVGLIDNKVRTAKVQGFVKAVHLLNEHAQDLANFLTNDEKGKLLPGYLNQIAEAQSIERQDILAEIERLTKSVEHIKNIVATQQAYARASCLVESVQVCDLVEEALLMNRGALSRHGITVVKEFSDVPMLPLDKHRILLILINLISNAKYAMDDQPGDSHQMTLRINMVDEKSVQICVQDEGVGIAAENLTRIFAHGFTTRAQGNGFGLHSCALAAKEMGGSLTAHSEGLGKGALFTLELPIIPLDAAL